MPHISDFAPIRRQVATLFSAILLLQKKLWKQAEALLPDKTCLLIADTQTPKRTEIIRLMARSFRTRG